MDLTFIVNVSLLILAVLSLAILGYGLLLWIADRLEQFEVRPVRMMRCDGRYYDTNSNPSKYYRFWKVPNLAINNIINGPS